MFGRATIRLGIGPHSSFICISSASEVFDILALYKSDYYYYYNVYTKKSLAARAAPPRTPLGELTTLPQTPS